MAASSDVLAAARGELGQRECPAGSNRTKYGAWFGLDGQPWCMMFVQWCFARAGAAALLPVRTASCGALMRAAQAAGRWVTADYRAGDVVIYDFPGGGTTDHTGIVERAAGGTVTAIEGNTGNGSDADGGQVQRRTRPLSAVRGAVRPLYAAENESEEEISVTYQYLKDVPEKFRPVVERLMDAGIVQGDGSDPAGNGDVIALTHEQVRTLVFVYRGGGFDRCLQAAGLPPAVQA